MYVMGLDFSKGYSRKSLLLFNYAISITYRIRSDNNKKCNMSHNNDLLQIIELYYSMYATVHLLLWPFSVLFLLCHLSQQQKKKFQTKRNFLRLLWLGRKTEHVLFIYLFISLHILSQSVYLAIFFAVRFWYLKEISFDDDLRPILYMIIYLVS